MILVVFSIKDIAADAFGRPFFVQTRALAVRSFSDEVNRKADDNMMNKHPSDFALYEIGLFDDSKGTITSSQPELVMLANQCVTQPTLL